MTVLKGAAAPFKEYAAYGGRLALNAYARHLRKLVRQYRHQELNGCTEAYRKQCRQEREHYQDALAEFNKWRANRAKKATR